MNTHKLLDRDHIDPAAWTCEAGVFFGSISADDDSGRDEYMGEALAECGGDWFLPTNEGRAGIVKLLGDSLIDSRFRAKGTCDHCGAWFKFGMVYRHTSGAAAVVGNTCAEKTMSVDSRNALILKRAKRLAEVKLAQLKFARERDAALTAFLSTDEGAKIALFLKNCDKGFLGSLNESLHKWGRLTPAQHAAVLKCMTPREPKVELPPSEYQGEVGKPLTVDVEIVATAQRETQFGVAYWHLMRDAKGHMYTARGVHLGERGDRIAATFTVKEHELYNGTSQTKLCRPRKLTRTRPVQS